MRYAIFTDIHANLEALEAVLAKIDKIAQEKPIDQIWFLGDLVGYGPDPNACITMLRERTDVIIAGNHDWAAVGKIDLEDFSAAARISAEWTAEQLTEEHRTFLANLPERLIIGDCTLVHGSPYGPLWEYLTSEYLAERSFQYFSTRYCFVGHTHIPVIFQQPDTISNTPTIPLANAESGSKPAALANGTEHTISGAEEKSEERATVLPPAQATMSAMATAESAYAQPGTGNTATEEEANAIIEAKHEQELHSEATHSEQVPSEDVVTVAENDATSRNLDEEEVVVPTESISGEEVSSVSSETTAGEEDAVQESASAMEDESSDEEVEQEIPVEELIARADDSLNSEIEELLMLLGLSQNMMQVTNEMITPPEGHWEAQEGHRAIINPGGVGQPRDGDPRAAFMIYDTESGFEFYRIPYPLEKTQEKIIQAGLPSYLAVRLAYGR